MGKARSNNARCLVAKLAAEQNHRCCYCHRTMTFNKSKRNRGTYATLEHITPKAVLKQRGVRTDLIYEECAAACKRCNSKRGVIDAYVFYDLQLWRDDRDNLRKRYANLAFFNLTGEIRYLRAVEFCL